MTLHKPTKYDRSGVHLWEGLSSMILPPSQAALGAAQDPSSQSLVPAAVLCMALLRDVQSLDKVLPPAAYTAGCTAKPGMHPTPSAALACLSPWFSFSSLQLYILFHPGLSENFPLLPFLQSPCSAACRRQ